MKRENTVKDAYYTVGVRFLCGDPRRIWTYRVRRSKKVHLGQELVADSPSGPAVVAVVRIDNTRQDTQPEITYKCLERKVSPL